MAKKHMFIPDCQIVPGCKLDHLEAAANYAVEKKPDEIILAGDWADMESLCSYDVGRKSFEGRTYKADIDSANEGLSVFMRPINAGIRVSRGRWKPRIRITLGNHENRINKAIELDRKLENLISTDDILFKNYGILVHPFLDVVTVDGIAYSHYFVSGVAGRAIGTAQQSVNKLHMSSVCGHQQGRQVAYGKRPDGSTVTCIIAGSFYQHEPDYLGVQGNKHWRGIAMFHEVHEGSFDEMFVSMQFLLDRYK